MDIYNNIVKCFNNDKIYYTKHALVEMENEEYGIILDNDVYKAINSSEVIEKYLDDKPYPSILLLGYTNKKRPIHIVCSYNKIDDIAIIITVYHPDPSLWIDYKRRK